MPWVDPQYVADREALEDRMANLAGRINDPDPNERAYASLWLGRLWALWEVAYATRG